MMIEKVEVRRRLIAYRKELKEKMQAIEEEVERMTNACITEEMKQIWYRSPRYIVLDAKWQMLYTVYLEIFDLVDEFDDEE